MNVKRYFGTTAREALRVLKAELGADAIVLSNRAVEGGVEILALPAEAAGIIQAHAAPSVPAASNRAETVPADRAERPLRPAMNVAREEDDFHVSLSAGSLPRQAPGASARTAPGAERTIRPFQPPRVELPRPDLDRHDALVTDGWDELGFGIEARPLNLRSGPRGLDPRVATGAAMTSGPAMESPREPVSAVVRPEGGAPGLDDGRVRELQQANARLMDELAGIRGMIERQLAGFAWGETRRSAPARASIVGELLEAGFSGPLARKLAEGVGEEASLAEARAQVRSLLGRDLRAMTSDADLIDRGGVYALVGPTGAGKTTTTAKLAARCVVRHGAGKLALITTDGYRIGAQEQLRIYGRILGVPVFPVRDAAELRQTLSELRGKHMVLIDTVGMSQRDRMVAQQAAMLAGAGNVRRLLLLNATCRGDTLDDVIQAYRGPDLAGCIFTKVDEAVSLAPAIGAAVTRELEVFYVTNGQRVPEDLHLPNRTYLVNRALRERDTESSWKLRDDEVALMMAAAGAEH